MRPHEEQETGDSEVTWRIVPPRPFNGWQMKWHDSEYRRTVGTQHSASSARALLQQSPGMRTLNAVLRTGMQWYGLMYLGNSIILAARGQSAAFTADDGTMAPAAVYHSPH